MRTQPARRGQLTEWPVTSVMSRPAVAIHVYATLAEALRAYAVAGIRHLAVLDATERCVGLLTDRAVAATWVRHPMLFDQLTVAQVLEGSQPLLRFDATIAQAARIMHGCGTDAVVVVSGSGEAMGVLTAGDLIALLAKPPVRADR
jgi:CBS domain-containing protein